MTDKVFDGDVNIEQVGAAAVPVVGSTPVVPVTLYDSSGNQVDIPVVTDESAQAATPKLINVGGEYRASDTTYSDGDATILQTDVNGKLKVSGLTAGSSSGSTSSVMIGSEIGSYTFDASAQTVTIAGTKTFKIEEILSIINVTDQEIIYSPSDEDKGGTISSNVITLEYDTTSMADTDDLQIFVQYNNSEDYDLAAQTSVVRNPQNSNYTDAEAIISAAQELDATFTDLGSEIDMKTYDQLGVWLTVDIGTSTNVELRLLHKHESGGAEEYREIYLDSPSSNLTVINLNDYQIGADSDQLFKINIPVSMTSPYIQLQVRDSADGDGQIDAAYITKAYAS